MDRSLRGPRVLRSLPQPPLLVISDRRQAGRPLAEIAAALFAAGCRWLSLREKDLPLSALAEEVAALAPLAEAVGACLSLHGSAVQARALGLTALQLPSGGDVAAARALLGNAAMIGLSLHAGEELLPEAAAALDYVTLSPVFPSHSKPGHGPPLGLSALREACQRLGLPVMALGGLEEPGLLADCRAAGAAGGAVMGAFMRSPEPGALFHGYLKAWEARR